MPTRGRKNKISEDAQYEQRHSYYDVTTRFKVENSMKPVKQEIATSSETTTTAVLGSGNLPAVYGAMIGCALAAIFMLTPILIFFGKKALARRRMRQFQSKRRSVVSTDAHKIFPSEVPRHQAVGRVESRDVGTDPETVANVQGAVEAERLGPGGGFTLIENFAYGDFIGCTDANRTTNPLYTLQETEQTAVDVVYVNLGSSLQRNKRRREHAYEMIDSTSTGLQIRESHHLLIPTVSGGKRHSRDKVTSFPFHPDCTESSENSKIDDRRLLLGVGYERRVSGGRPNTKNHVTSSKWKNSSNRYKAPGSLASSYSRGKEEQTTTTMEQLIRDRNGTRIRRKRRLKRKTHDLRRKRAHTRHVAAIKRHQVGGTISKSSKEATILDVDEEVCITRGRTSMSSVSNYSTINKVCDVTMSDREQENHRSSQVSADGVSSSHSTADRGYGTGVSVGKFRLPCISEQERASSSRDLLKCSRRLTAHGQLSSSAEGSAQAPPVEKRRNLEHLKIFSRSSSKEICRKSVLKSRSVPHLDKIQSESKGGFIKNSTSVLDVLGCYMKSKNYNTDHSRSVLRIQDTNLTKDLISKPLAEDSTCSGGSVVSCPLLGQIGRRKSTANSVSLPKVTKKRPTSVQCRQSSQQKSCDINSRKSRSRSLHDVAYDIIPLERSVESLSVFMEMSI